MNDAAEQRPQTSPRRLHTRGNPQIQGYTSLIDGLFVVRFAGRMCRVEYWSKLILLSLLLVILLSLELLALGETIVLSTIIPNLTLLLLGLVAMGMTVRRLHDVGFSGWVMFCIVPITMVTSFIASKLTDLTSFAPTPTNSLTYEVAGRVSFFCLLFLFNLLFAVPLLSNGEPRKNKYGPNPKEDVRGWAVASEPSPTKGLFIVRFAGRMRRAEYWFKIIPLTLLSYFLSSLEWSALGDNIVLFVIIYILTMSPLCLLTMGMTSRRLHDAGFSGWMMLWIVIPSIFFIAPMLSDFFTSREDVLNRVGFVPVLFYVFFLMLLLLDSEPGENKYGPNLGGAEVADAADSESEENEYDSNPMEDIRGWTVTREPSFIKGLFTVRFAGRMRRRKFWLSQLLLWPLNCLFGYGSILGTITASLFGRGELLGAPLILLWILYAYFSLVSLGMQVRRLHDIGISGRKYLLGIIIYFLASILWYELFPRLASVIWHDPNEIIVPIVLSAVGGAIPSVLGFVILIVLFCQDSQYGVNQWGLNPKGQGNEQAVEAAEKYRLAVEQGDADAQYDLGLCYYHGNGVKINPTEAAKWFRLAAEQGLAKAQFKLGECYVSGKGVDKDETEAVRWYRLAAEQELAMAQNKLGMCYYSGEGVDKDYIEAIKWYRRAADKGNTNAMYRLGIGYLEGTGIEKDEKQAKQWLRKAADAGYYPAKALLRQLEKK